MVDLKPYKEMIRSINVYQLSGGQWVSLIKIPIENPEEATPETIQEIIESIHNAIHKSDKIELSIQGVSISIRSIDKNQSTFKVQAESF